MEQQQLLAASRRYRDIYEAFVSMRHTRAYMETMLDSPSIRAQTKRACRRQLVKYNHVINGLIKDMKPYELGQRI